MSTQTLNLDEKLYTYLQAVSLREAGILEKLRAETAGLENAQMQISPEQGQFMQLLLQLSGARQAIEIGVFTGYSSLCIALALPPEGKLVACDINPAWTDTAQRYWQTAGVADKIELRLGRAVNTLKQLLADGGAEQFDFAFIDADKAGYDTYYELCLQLLRAGGLLAIDNTLWSGRVADDNIQDDDTVAIRSLNKKLHLDQRVDISLLPIGDGLTLARKRC